MKIKFKALSIVLCFTILISCIAVIKPNSSYALEWNTENVTVSNLQIKNGKLNAIDLHFEVPDYLGEATCWAGFQSVQFNEGNIAEYDYGNLTDYGTIYNKGYSGVNDVKADKNFVSEYGIEGFSDENGFPCFGEYYSTVYTTISDMNISLDQNKEFYIYLWTFNGENFYPDKLIGTVSIDNGEIEVTDYEEKNVTIEKTESFETIEKVEIEDSNTALTVGEKPTLTAKIKNNEYNIEIIERFVAEDRTSVFTTEKESSSDEDGLVKDHKYLYVIDLNLEENENKRLDKTTKVFVNGIEKNVAYVSESGSVLIIEDETITPEGYIAPSELEENFETKQRTELEELILQAIKEGKVKYEEGFENIINEALENEDEIVVDFAVSKTMRRSIVDPFIEKEIINSIDKKISGEQKLQAYCIVGILVFVDGEVGYISELSTPIPVTIPFPNGVPQLKEGYERVWKVIRYHDGIVEVLNAKQTENGIEFLNDKFSQFAIVYEDIKLEEPETTEEPKEQEETEKQEENKEQEEVKEEIAEKTGEISNPKTGDYVLIVMFIIVISVLGIVGTIIISKKKK